MTHYAKSFVKLSLGFRCFSGFHCWVSFFYETGPRAPLSRYVLTVKKDYADFISETQVLAVGIVLPARW